jgi:acyl carrier protein
VNPEEKGCGLKREDLLALSPGDRSFALEECIQHHVAQVLQVAPRQIDTNEPLGSYGLESAKGNELIASLGESLGLTLSATTIFNYPSVAELSRYIASLMDVAFDQNEAIAPETPAPEDESLAALLGAVERVSVSELQEMIQKRREGNNPPEKAN